MATYNFKLPIPDGPAVVIIRMIDNEADAIALAKRIAKDWPDAPTVDVSVGEKLVHREFNRPSDA